eukprot:NODE_833_length_1163_cov_211.815978_g587_i0.p4 GENE.NODE_833_length_1163_cov_211.815978_g587_i0~~NODE_833_length_1163_cov_211.815978_g587_i0.p4  ORF type:complete len:53 (+),score=5.29 NODE_833_length_1163_cov_211.815978_g587_i0:25-159(+)
MGVSYFSVFIMIFNIDKIVLNINIYVGVIIISMIGPRILFCSIG